MQYPIVLAFFLIITQVHVEELLIFAIAVIFTRVTSCANYYYTWVLLIVYSMTRRKHASVDARLYDVLN